MRPETRQSMEMLFAAKWNLPKAAKNCNLTDKEMKITFNEYCRLNGPTYELGDQLSKEVPLDPKPVYPPKKFVILWERGGIGRRTRLKIC